MENERDTTQVIMSLQKAAMFMDPFFKLTMMGTAFLMTYLARMAKEKKITIGEFNDVQDFIKSTNGKYTIINLPYSKEYSPWKIEKKPINGKDRYVIQNSITGEIIKNKRGEEMSWSNKKKADMEAARQNQREDLALDELKHMGIRHVILPDLDRNDGLVQIALYDEDKEKFAGWQERYLLSRLQGGEQSLQELQNLTKGNVSLFTVPVRSEDVEKMKQDFKKLQINYVILPVQHDGLIELAIYNQDQEKFLNWKERYIESNLQGGELDLKHLQNLTNGNVSLVSLSFENDDVERIKDELKKMGVNYAWLSTSDEGKVDLAIFNEDKEEFDLWKENYIISKLQGGERDLQNFQNFAEGDIFIVTLPIKNDDLEKLKEDFENLKINYAILPDLNLNDGMIELAIFNEDKERFLKWQERYLELSLQGGEQTLQELQNLTNGNVMLITLPIEADELEKVKRDFEEFNINYAILSNPEKDDKTIQIALYDGDREKLELWKEGYLATKLHGGRQEIQELRSLTGGNTSLISLPIEGEELKKMMVDFRELKINYAILPDLNVGDGETQIMVANSDLPSVEFWHKLYNQDLIKRGEKTTDIKNMTMESYRETGNMTEEQYADTACEEYRRANAKYEGREPGEAEKAIKNEEKGIRSINCEAFDTYNNNSDFLKISIDKETLVDNSRYGRDAKIRERGLFTCRIPGSYGENELTLAVPTDKVFSYNGGRQFYVFLKKDEKPFVLEPTGKMIPEDRRKTGEELRKFYFDPQEKTVKKTPNKQMSKDFNNFERRNYDFEAMEKALLGK